MTAVLIGRFEPGSTEWHAARANGLGGSEVAPLLGLSPYESRFSLWHRKAGNIGPVEETEIMEAGKRLEPVILEKFRDSHPEFLVTGSATYAHHERTWQVGNPDGEIHLPELGVSEYPVALIECKYALYDDEWGEPGTDEIPIHYRCQVQWYLDVFGIDTCYLMVFIGSQGQFREYVIRADAGEQQILRSAAVEFLASLTRGEQPDVDAHSATYQAIRELHPDINGDKVDLSTETAVRYCHAKAAEKAAKEDAQLATSLVAAEMGNAKTAMFAGQRLASRQARGDGTPYVVAARNLPDSIELKEAS